MEAKQSGANGIVVGILNEDGINNTRNMKIIICSIVGDVDVERMKILINLSAPLPITFHRAFGITY